MNILYNNYLHTVYAFELDLRFPNFQYLSLPKYIQNQHIRQREHLIDF